MMGEAVLDHSQDVEGRVGEILKPLTTPVHCRGRGREEKNELREVKLIIIVTEDGC